MLKSQPPTVVRRTQHQVTETSAHDARLRRIMQNSNFFASNNNDAAISIIAKRMYHEAVYSMKLEYLQMLLVCHCDCVSLVKLDRATTADKHDIAGQVGEGRDGCTDELTQQ